MGIEVHRNQPIPRAFADSAEHSYERLRLLLIEKEAKALVEIKAVRLEAVQVLMVLGLKRKEAEAKLNRIVVEPGVSSAELVRLALRG